MNLAPSEEQEMIRDLVRRVLADQVAAGEIGRGPIAMAHWQALGALDLFGMALPERCGGMGGAPQDVAILAEEFGRALAITPLGEGIVGAAALIARHGDQTWIDRYVLPAMRGETVLALALGDVRDSAGTLHGACDFVRWAPAADAIVVLGNRRVDIVPTGAPGLTIAPIRLIDGSVAGAATFDGCAADGFAVTVEERTVALAMVELCHVAEMVGAMAMLYEQTIDHVRQRRQFGAAIGSFQVVQHRMARLFVALEQSRSILLKAAVANRADPHFVRGVTAAKAYVADAAQRLAEDAVQLHGGMGVTDDLPVGRGLRRVMILARLFGDAAAARARLAA